VALSFDSFFITKVASVTPMARATLVFLASAM
jgi:hypothetical protein